MATPLDIGLFKHFGSLFPFLLVLVLGYAVLVNTFFKDKKGLAAMIAFILGLATLMSNVAMKVINTMAPWFVLFMIFGILVVIPFTSLGVPKDHIEKLLKTAEHGSTLFNWVIAIMLIIGVGSLAVVINEEKPFVGWGGDNSSVVPDQDEEVVGFWPTLFHPKMLGMILVLLVSYFTITYLTK